MEPYYKYENITLWHGDCSEIMPQLKPVDLCLTDPPFGVGNFIQITGKLSGMGDQKGKRVDWNECTPDKTVFDMICKISKRQIIWGANYFNCFSGHGGAIVWLKNQGLPNFSKCEIASCSFYKKTEIVKINWNGGAAKSLKKTTHPCERPVSIYDWCIEYAKNVKSILDPFAGSGSSAISALRYKIPWTGIEREKKYCNMIKKRIEIESKQKKLF